MTVFCLQIICLYRRILMDIVAFFQKTVSVCRAYPLIITY